jgi:hypothetical protein
MTAGRTCPLSYRYSPAAFRAEATRDVDTLYVAGGLYGNETALASLLRMFEAEPGRKRLLFNGDFHWFDIAPESFRRINETVLSFDAIRGNVETELAGDEAELEAVGCGCGYPDWVGDEVVRHSNRIMRQLAATAALFPALRQRLAALPMWRRIDVGGVPLGIVHGDAESLAGWGFAQEHLADEAHRAIVKSWFDRAGVRLFAGSHTCLPVIAGLANSGGERCLVVNNGAAGMPNFSGRPEGVLTRIATTPAAANSSWYGTRLDGLYVDALPIALDTAGWHRAFLAQWPAGSAAHQSYWRRINEGPAYRIEQAQRY